MRHMSFALTVPQLLDGSKTVTRRLGWSRLRKGDRLRAVRKSQGLKKGERVVALGEVLVLDVRREPLRAIDQADCAREGLPWLSPAQFISTFCRAMRCEPGTMITRIEFEFEPGEAQ